MTLTTIGKITFYVIAAIAIMFFAALAGALIGAACGWIVGFTPLGNWILQFLAALQIHTNMVDFGAFCGFVGGFFQSYSRSKD